MATRDIIVIGASAGGVQALYKLVSALPPDLPAAVFIVLHIPAHAPSRLPEILSRDSHLTVAHAVDGERIKHGKIYVAPPDRHLLIEDSHVKLVHGPKENRHRPSIDTLFRSAARWAGSRVIGTVLTGARDDGTAGMRAIKQRGGIAIVQDPHEARFPSMPLSVLQGVRVDYSVPLDEIPPLLDSSPGKLLTRKDGIRCRMKLKSNPELPSKGWKATNCWQASRRLAGYRNSPVPIVTALSGKSTI